MKFILLGLLAFGSFSALAKDIIIPVYPEIPQLNAILEEKGFNIVSNKNDADYYISVNGNAGNPCDVQLSIVSIKDNNYIATGYGNCVLSALTRTETLTIPSVYWNVNVQMPLPRYASANVASKALRRAIKDLLKKLE